MGHGSYSNSSLDCIKKSLVIRCFFEALFSLFHFDLLPDIFSMYRCFKELQSWPCAPAYAVFRLQMGVLLSHNGVVYGHCIFHTTMGGYRSWPTLFFRHKKMDCYHHFYPACLHYFLFSSPCFLLYYLWCFAD